jgi:3-(3-hydroxy-phenyl)propionate hydroxylase
MSDERVIIVGAGPVGLLNALGLARAGIKVTVLEREPAIPASPRAMVYIWKVLEGLERLGVLADAEAIGFTTQHGLQVRVFATGEQIFLPLDVLEGHVPHPYNLNLGQHRLAQIAMEHLEAIPGEVVRFGTQMTALHQDDDGVTVQVQDADGATETLRAGWVIGTDGAGSSVRKALGLGFAGMTWPERFVATNVLYDFQDLGYSDGTFLVDPAYGAVIARIDREGLWRCTYCEDARLPEESIPERMPAYFKAILPEGAPMPEVVSWSPYKMHQRAADRMRVGRVLLAGDAAHATNPTGGMGLTSGLFDTYVLYEALAAVIHGEADASVLDAFSDARLKIFLEQASPAASEFKRLVFHSHDPERLDHDLEPMRRVAADRDALLQMQLGMASLETPSLVGADW